MEIAVLGIDLGKTTCSVAGLDGDGAVVLRKRIRRHRLLAFLSEACGGAHHLGHFCVERRCCRTLTAKDSHHESMRLDGANEQARTCPLPYDELVHLQRCAQEARFASDLAG